MGRLTRLAAVLTAFEDINAPEVSLAHMDNGIALAAYYLREALRIANYANPEEHIRIAEDIRVWIFERWDEDIVTPRDIQNGGPGGLRSSLPKIKRALAVLVDHGWLAPLPPGTVVNGTSRKEAYQLVRPDDFGEDTPS